MHPLAYEIDCKHCGCPDVEVERTPKPGQWFASGWAHCNECGSSFAFREPEETEPAQDRFVDSSRAAVIYRPVKCPECNSSDVPVQHSNLPVRYHRCRGCGETFKSVEKD